jgi:DNA-binding response OmpR family regulator
MHTILIVEDEALIRESMTTFLSMHYRVVAVEDGEAALETVATDPPDVIILDIGLPGTDGFDVCRRLRHQGLRAPILFLSSHDQEVDKLTGFGVGGDDYIVKPVSLPELQARVHAALRRARGSLADFVEVYRWGGVSVNFVTREVLVDGEAVALSVKEMELLRYFLEHRGAVLSRSSLLTEVWHYDDGVSSRTLDTHVLNLRRKLRDGADGTSFFVTVRGVGYRFKG